MKDSEKKFFKLCTLFIGNINGDSSLDGEYTPRQLIKILEQWLPPKRALYYLKKWDTLGFYDYGVALDMGWFYLDKIPQRYRDVLDEPYGYKGD